jgi:hypothetical protein
VKSLSVIVTVLLLVLANHLAVRLKKAGTLPLEDPRTPGGEPFEGSPSSQAHYRPFETPPQNLN